MEDLLTRGHDHVGNQLLKRRIFLRLSPGNKEVVARLQEDRKVAANFRIEAVKGTKLIKKRATDDKDLFGGRHKKGGILKIESFSRRRFLVSSLIHLSHSFPEFLSSRLI
jgi:hypothetical protein